MRALDALGAEALEPVHLSGQVIGVDVHMHTRGPLAEALHEQPEILAVQRRAVILGVVEAQERLAQGCLPEQHLTIMIVGGDIDNNLEEPAEVRHGIKLRRPVQGGGSRRRAARNSGYRTGTRAGVRVAHCDHA
jgi:hypothetical protein